MDFIQNRLFYHMLRRIGQALLFLLGTTVVIFVMSILVKLSSTHLGTTLPVLVLFVVSGLGLMSYLMAREDVKMEEMRNERIRNRLTGE